MKSTTADISALIGELIRYAISEQLIEEADRIYCINRLLELFDEIEYATSEEDKDIRDLHLILEDLTDIAVEKGSVPIRPLQGICSIQRSWG